MDFLVLYTYKESTIETSAVMGAKFDYVARYLAAKGMALDIGKVLLKLISVEVSEEVTIPRGIGTNNTYKLEQRYLVCRKKEIIYQELTIGCIL